MANYYALLTLSPQANLSDIKARYHQLSLRYHPDRGGSTEKMMQLNEAYRVLSNPLLRREYDQKYATPPKSNAHATYASSYTHASYARPAPTDESANSSEPLRRQTAQSPHRQPVTETRAKSSFWSWFGLVLVMALGFLGYEIYTTLQPSTAAATTTSTQTNLAPTTTQPVTPAQDTSTASDTTYPTTNSTATPKYRRHYRYSQPSTDSLTPSSSTSSSTEQ